MRKENDDLAIRIQDLEDMLERAKNNESQLGAFINYNDNVQII